MLINFFRLLNFYVIVITEVKNRKSRVIRDITSVVEKCKNDFLYFVSFMEIFEEKSTKTLPYI